MFNKIINAIYDSFMHPPAKSKENQQQQTNNNESSDQRRFSSANAQQPDIPSLLNKKSEALLRRASVSQAIPIGKSNITRRTSIFGISNIPCDDYVQKDLISSSWS